MSNTEKISLIEESPSDYGSTGVLSGAQSTSVSFHSISYLIQEGVFKKTTKTILNNASYVKFVKDIPVILLHLQWNHVTRS